METNLSGLYKNSQFDYCRRLLLPRFVQSCFLCCGMVQNGIPSCFLFHWRVWKGIVRVCLYICSAERNSELFSLPRKGSERNSENFLFPGTAGIPSEITTCSVNSADVNFCNQRAHLWVWICQQTNNMTTIGREWKVDSCFENEKLLLDLANLIPYLVPTHILNF